jgi:hypothetical protein
MLSIRVLFKFHHHFVLLVGVLFKFHYHLSSKHLSSYKTSVFLVARLSEGKLNQFLLPLAHQPSASQGLLILEDSW